MRLGQNITKIGTTTCPNGDRAHFHKSLHESIHGAALSCSHEMSQKWLCEDESKKEFGREIEIRPPFAPAQRRLIARRGSTVVRLYVSACYKNVSINSDG